MLHHQPRFEYALIDSKFATPVRQLIQTYVCASELNGRLFDSSRYHTLQHRVVVTDSTGLVHCFSVKRGVVETDFKTHLQHNGSAAAVDAVALGGAVGNRDKIFVSSGSTVRGFTRKGKEFFEMRTNLSESLHHMAVEDVHLYVSRRCLL